MLLRELSAIKGRILSSKSHDGGSAVRETKNCETPSCAAHSSLLTTKEKSRRLSFQQTISWLKNRKSSRSQGSGPQLLHQKLVGTAQREGSFAKSLVSSDRLNNTVRLPRLPHKSLVQFPSTLGTELGPWLKRIAHDARYLSQLEKIPVLRAYIFGRHVPRPVEIAIPAKSNISPASLPNGSLSGKPPSHAFPFSIILLPRHGSGQSLDQLATQSQGPRSGSSWSRSSPVESGRIGRRKPNRRPGRNATSQNEKGVSKLNKQNPGWWVCPLFRINPKKHFACVVQKPQTITHLKQHIHRSHVLLVCPTCMEVFGNSEERDGHIQGRGCSVRQGRVHLDGFTESQDDTFQRERFTNDENGWNRIWEAIVRDREPKPQLLVRSPFIHDEMTELMGTLRELSKDTRESIAHGMVRNDSSVSLDVARINVEWGIDGFIAFANNFPESRHPEAHQPIIPPAGTPRDNPSSSLGPQASTQSYSANGSQHSFYLGGFPSTNSLSTGLSSIGSTQNWSELPRSQESWSSLSLSVEQNSMMLHDMRDLNVPTDNSGPPLPSVVLHPPVRYTSSTSQASRPIQAAPSPTTTGRPDPALSSPNAEFPHRHQ